MAQSNLLLKAEGLYTYPSHLSAVPPGSLLVARNITISRQEVAESRRGYKIYGSAMGSTATNIAHQLLNYKGRVLRHWGTGAGTTLDVDSDGSGTFTTLAPSTRSGTLTSAANTVTSISSTSDLYAGMGVSGTGVPAGTTISSITSNTALVLSNNASMSGAQTLSFTYLVQEASQGTRIKFIEQNSNLYFTTSNGIQKISATSAANVASSTIQQAGTPTALDIQATRHASAGFLTTQSVIAYRVVWGINDANNNLILGAPSSRTILRNQSTSITYTADLKFQIPSGITTANFYQVYRTAVFADNVLDASGNPLPQDPGDEQGLVYENNPTNTDLTNGYILMTDIVPDTMRGANLYTNSLTGSGIISAQYPPPFALDITTFKDYTFLANTKTQQSLNLSMLSVSQFVSGTSNLTITNGTSTNTYTFKTLVSNGTTTSGSNTITGIASTATISVGLSVSGTGIPYNATVTSIASGTSVVISANATASGTVSITYAIESASSKYVGISQFATPSQQVDETARSLVRMINSQSSEIVYAYYLSGVSDVPGLLLFQAKNLSSSAFSIGVNATASTGIEFSPILPTQGGSTTLTSVLSTNQVSPNRIFYSQYKQPDAVPLLNYVDIGPKDKRILRILALRDNLFILKEEGIYRLSGLVAPFTVFPFDFSTNVSAPDSAVVLNNLIYCITNQGVSTVSDTGVAIISTRIEDKLLPLNTPAYTNFLTATFGISYESDRSYYLFTVTNTTDTYATQCLKFNTFTQSWTSYDISKRSGLVNTGDNNLYLSAIDTNYIEQERKNFDRTDYSDREYTITLVAQTVSMSIVFPSLTNISVDDVAVQTQYLTIDQFNQLLNKLDRDSVVNSRNYTSTLAATPGINLSNQLDALLIKISTDPGRVAAPGSTSAITYTALVGGGSASFTALQTTFNSLIALLNADLGVGFRNYLTSTGTTPYEFPILTTNSGTLTITTDYVYPLIAGVFTVYNHIPIELQWVPQFFGDVSMSKQVSEGTLIFEDASFSNGVLSYSSDLSANFEPQTITGNGNGIFGGNLFGNGIFGGNGSGIPFRTYIPQAKQFCRYMNVQFSHTRARELVYLYGCSLSWRPISSRGWR